MAFYKLTIEGDKSYGGYLAVDGRGESRFEDDMVYEIPNGEHAFTLFSKSAAERGTKGVYDWARNNSSSSFMDNITDRIMAGTEGQRWDVKADLGEKDCAIITVYTERGEFVAEPDFDILHLNDETYEGLKEEFERIRNTPRRNGKQIAWGIGLMAAFGFGAFNALSSGVTDLSVLGVMGGGIAIGLLLFILGMRKIIRK